MAGQSQSWTFWKYLIGILIVFLVVGFFLTLPHAPTTAASPTPFPTSLSNQADLSASGSYEVDGLTVNQKVDESGTNHVESIEFSQLGEKSILIIVPKTLATRASDVTVEADQLLTTDVLQDDPWILIALKGTQAKIQTANKLSKKRSLVISVPSGMTKEQLQDYLKSLPDFPEDAFDEKAVAGLSKKISDALRSDQPKTQLEKVLQENAAGANPSAPVTQIESLTGVRPARIIDFSGSGTLKPFQSFSFSATQGGALLRFRILLPVAADYKIDQKPDFELSDASSKFALVKKIDSLSVVPGSGGYLHEFSVLLQLRPNQVVSGEFPEINLQGSLKFPIPIADIPQKTILVTVHFDRSKPFLHAGYFTFSDPTRPNVVFLTNDAPFKLEKVTVCGRTLDLDAKSGYAIPVKPSGKAADYCDITQGGKTEATVFFSDAHSYFPGSLSYLTSYNKDLDCDSLKTVLFDHLLAYGQNLKTIDPDSYVSLYGSDFSQVFFLRTQAGMDQCPLPQPFEVFGQDVDHPQKLADGHVYVLQIHGALPLKPQVLAYGTLDAVKAESKDVADLFNSDARSFWQDRLALRSYSSVKK